MDTSNQINLGILILTGVGCALTIYWARKANNAQLRANTAADRSAAAAEQSVRLQHEALAIEKQRQSDEAMEAQRASLRAEIVRKNITVSGAPRTEHCITITNDSRYAIACNVRYFANGKPLSEYRECRTAVPEGEVIHPGGKVELLLKSGGSDALSSPFKLRLVWDDDSGRDREWEGPLRWR
jgi:hypothetical protein